MVLPKPGFPQRITQSDYHNNSNVAEDIPNDDSKVPESSSATKNGPFDYLYEFSETRKVLEDFFKSPDTTSHIDLQSDTSETVSC